MKVGARNQLVGTVTEVKKGSVMAQVKLPHPGWIEDGIRLLMKR